MKETINYRTVSNGEELRDALDVLLGDAGEHPSTVYVTLAGEDATLLLEEETLSDGSKVYNLRLFPANAAPLR